LTQIDPDRDCAVNQICCERTAIIESALAPVRMQVVHNYILTKAAWHEDMRTVAHTEGTKIGQQRMVSMLEGLATDMVPNKVDNRVLGAFQRELLLELSADAVHTDLTFVNLSLTPARTIGRTSACIDDSETPREDSVYTLGARAYALASLADNISFEAFNDYTLSEGDIIAAKELADNYNLRKYKVPSTTGSIPPLERSDDRSALFFGPTVRVKLAESRTIYYGEVTALACDMLRMQETATSIEQTDVSAKNSKLMRSVSGLTLMKNALCDALMYSHCKRGSLTVAMVLKKIMENLITAMECCSTNARQISLAIDGLDAIDSYLRLRLTRVSSYRATLGSSEEGFWPDPRETDVVKTIKVSRLPERNVIRVTAVLANILPSFCCANLIRSNNTSLEQLDIFTGKYLKSNPGHPYYMGAFDWKAASYQLAMVGSWPSKISRLQSDWQAQFANPLMRKACYPTIPMAALLNLTMRGMFHSGITSDALRERAAYITGLTPMPLQFARDWVRLRYSDETDILDEREYDKKEAVNMAILASYAWANFAFHERSKSIIENAIDTEWANQ